MELFINETRYTLRLLSPTFRYMLCPKCGESLRLSDGQYSGAEDVKCSARRPCKFTAKINFAQELEKWYG